jgi:unsaturated rhamnogalacturonyl hydrolase
MSAGYSRAMRSRSPGPRSPRLALLLGALMLPLTGCSDPKGTADTALSEGVPLDTLPLARQVVDQGAALYDPTITLLDWIPTVWAWGVHRTYAATGDAEVQGWYRAWMDDAMADFDATHFVSSDSTSPALMAATLMWEDDSTDYAPITEAADAYLAAAPRTENGALVHWGPDNPWGFPSDQVWVDTQFMIGLFWLRQYQRTGDVAYLNEFVDQYERFSELLRDEQDQLYRHAWDDAGGVNIPSDATYWARGNAWALVSGAELLQAVGEGDPAWDRVAPLYAAHMAATLPLQADDGLWHTVLNRGDDSANYTETSASALIGYALVVGISAGAPIDEAAARAAIGRAAAGIQDRIEEDGDGVLHLEGTSMGTNPSTYEAYLAVPQLDDLMLGWGAVAMFLAEADGVVVP